MKTIQQIKDMYTSKTLDGRDVNRLVQFLAEPDLKVFGIELKDEFVGKHEPIPFTKENILKQLDKDVRFGFEKALNQRGISSSFMFSTVQMWNWILEEGLEDWRDDKYAQYGLPLFKATALKYGFENPIGEDRGDEYKYASGY